MTRMGQHLSLLRSGTSFSAAAAPHLWKPLLTGLSVPDAAVARFRSRQATEIQGCTGLREFFMIALKKK